MEDELGERDGGPPDGQLLAWFRYSSTTDPSQLGLGSGRRGQFTWYAPSAPRDVDWPGLDQAFRLRERPPVRPARGRCGKPPFRQGRRRRRQAPQRRLPARFCAGKRHGRQVARSGVHVLPGVVLIDPDGKVAAKNSSPPNAESVIAKTFLERR